MGRPGQPPSLLLALGPSFALAVAACSAPPAPRPETVIQIPAASSAPFACAAGRGDCDQNRANACETRLDSSSAHCGACGVTCNAGQTCLMGACQRASVLSAADSHACALTPSGAVRCWGDSTSGQLGDAANDVQSVPVELKIPGEVVAIRAGDRVSCAVLRGGMLYCWGEGRTRLFPDLNDVTDVALRDDKLCALHLTGKVTCAEPILLEDEPSAEPEPSDDEPKEPPGPDIEDAIAITAGEFHTCALLRTGEVACWGDVEFTGSSADERPQGDSEELERHAVKVKGITDAVQIASRNTHTCAVRKTGSIACWGWNPFDELGGVTHEDPIEPVDVQGISDAVEVSTGASHTCALRSTGEVACWGSSLNGEIGTSPHTPYNPGESPIIVQGLKDATHITAGERFSCATRASGAVQCWGSAARGRLGNGTTAEYREPVVVKGVEGATALALGAEYSCALTRGGTVTCWGRGSNDYDSEATRERGVPPVKAPGLTDAVTLRTFTSIVCAVKKSGQTWCFRGSVPSYLDETEGEESSEWHPTRIHGLDPAKLAIHASRTSLALAPSGKATLWSTAGGWWSSTAKKPVTRQAIAGLSDVVDLAAHHTTLCAVRRSGKVACFAYDAHKALDPKKPMKLTPLGEVEALTDATQITNDSAKYCALRKTGEMTCWSVSPPRPAGESPGTAPRAPHAKGKPGLIPAEAVKGLKDATLLAMGSGFSCALRRSGDVVCAGENAQGQLGHGDFDPHPSLVPVKGLSDAVSIAAAETHACAVKKSGAVVCWGSNEEDQVGANDMPWVKTPVTVTGLGGR